MPRWLIALIVLISTALLLATVAAYLARPSTVITPMQSGNESATIRRDAATGARSFTARPGLEGLAIPEFSLVDQNGNAVDESLLDGQITVLAFIFTHCQLACPPMTAGMFRAYKDLEGTPVRFVSISVDPVNDTPERLREYAANLSIDTDRWRFLTGEEGVTARIVEESLKFSISPDPDDANIITLGEGRTMRNIRHPTRLFLVGPDRRILDLCAPTVEDDLARFTKIARQAAKQ